MRLMMQELTEPVQGFRGQYLTSDVLLSMCNGDTWMRCVQALHAYMQQITCGSLRRSLHFTAS